MVKKDYNDISGGRQAIKVDNIMGVNGLSCWNAPTKDDDCLAWEYNGEHIPQSEAWKILNSNATRNLNNEEKFLEYYIETYNSSLLDKFGHN